MGCGLARIGEKKRMLAKPGGRVLLQPFLPTLCIMTYLLVASETHHNYLGRAQRS